MFARDISPSVDGENYEYSCKVALRSTSTPFTAIQVFANLGMVFES